MAIDRKRAKPYLKAFDFRPLFVDVLGWDKYTASFPVSLGGTAITLKGTAEKRGVVVFVCEEIPDYASRLKLEKQVAKSHFEHFIIFTDKPHGRQIWQWARREPGRPLRVREHRYETSQSGELLIQKLENVVVTLEQEESFTLLAVTHGLRAAFDVETVTKKFYDRFKDEHERFLKFIKGIPDGHMEGWYASVMMNRLMFLYFIQAKSFLDGNVDYLRDKLSDSKGRGSNRYYREFLCPLFFEGSAKRKDQRSSAVNNLLGDVPYLNGGLFQRHQIEERHGKKIEIPDTAFDRLFDFFKEYQWHLDERPDKDDREINPDVLGYIFEKYINQKQMGAYYTKEDITEYISKNTIIPYLFDAAKKRCAVAFETDGYVWRLTRENPDRYIHQAIRMGRDRSLPPAISAGVENAAKRGKWNQRTPFDEEPQNFLPTETWRELVDRRHRYSDIRDRLDSGGIVTINDFVTLNIDIRQFAEDVIQYSEGPELVRAFYEAISSVSVLDPTCGSGAFLFAALNVLKPLYEACLKRMDAFVEESDAKADKLTPEKFKDFRAILTECRNHPNQDYFVLKSIIINNLYGVDIMEEAIEICKLRLFLKLVAQVDSQDRIEPLPDIDFNIHAGNTLVGYARYKDVEKAITSKFDFGGAMEKIEDKAKILDSAVAMFRQQQTQLQGTITIEDKLALRKRFAELNAELNDYLVGQFSKTVTSSAVAAWCLKYTPLHWFSEFHSLMSGGGFDVVIGNPPYVEEPAAPSSPLGGFLTAPCGDLYAYVCERAYSLLHDSGRIGLIVPISIFGTDGFKSLQDLTRQQLQHVWVSSYSNRPSQLFIGAQKRLTILIGQKGAASPQFRTGAYLRWVKEEREALFPARIRYSARTSVCRVFPASVEKIATPIELSIFEKLLSCGHHLEASIVRQSGYSVYYTRKFGYFLAFLDFVPEVVEITTGKAVPPSELKSLCFQSKRAVSAAVAALSSTTFFWFWNTLSDCRNLNRRDLLAFPLDVEKLPKPVLEQLAQLGTEYLRCLTDSSRFMTKSGLRIQTFDYGTCKPIIDRIDRVLGGVFSLNDEEVDFIANYDIKYRMRPETDEGD
jgi:type I restriction-modification system DNA methylase subunit